MTERSPYAESILARLAALDDDHLCPLLAILEPALDRISAAAHEHTQTPLPCAQTSPARPPYRPRAAWQGAATAP